MYLKIHKSGNEVLVAACDEELLGMKLKYGTADVEINEEFYGGEIVSEKEIISALESATTANLFGERAVTCGIKCGAIDPKCVINIDGYPHAQLFRI
ncbi:Protein of unknown function DUF424 [Methanosalsum zhilinae DSM 4017]|uniref:DUF424 domain-containing protein n=1 Tax=Methanosalsum zhilinae (strain DSM 4017 / NBRC 107636 / OCM 62 / WeN5) TaxID=679901 RepID=F7XQF8_METZD|nr:DUF424 family protein [Methanosalsum zhilinae]AEH60459.1 Protein of unknown function DUF424 [Methanosalsum zhilinae DSM 4017]